MDKKYLVLGATGSIGFAFTNELLSQGIKPTIFVRNRKKAQILFNNNELLEIIEGDVTNLEKLKKIIIDKDVIFYGINYPFNLWYQYMEPITKNLIDFAQQNNSTILFPGNIYPFGNISEKITETTIPVPTTKKGALRFRLLKMLEDATKKGECNVIVLRLPDFFGPNVTNGLIEPIFGNASKNKPIEWLINTSIPHQFVYTKDAAKLFFMLSQKAELPNYFLINYGGKTVSSLKSFGKQIGTVTGGTTKVKTTPKFILNILALFVPVVKELKENFYQFENTILLDDAKIQGLFPNFQSTNLKDSIKETIHWFKNSTY